MVLNNSGHDDRHLTAMDPRRGGLAGPWAGSMAGVTGLTDTPDRYLGRHLTMTSRTDAPE